MILSDVWPAQRPNRKKISEPEKQYRARVRKNKQRVAREARASQRQSRAAQRQSNRDITERNKQAIAAAQPAPKKDRKTRQQKAADTRRFQALRKIALYNQASKRV